MKHSITAAHPSKLNGEAGAHSVVQRSQIIKLADCLFLDIRLDA